MTGYLAAHLLRNGVHVLAARGGVADRIRHGGAASLRIQACLELRRLRWAIRAGSTVLHPDPYLLLFLMKSDLDLHLPKEELVLFLLGVSSKVVPILGASIHAV